MFLFGVFCREIAGNGHSRLLKLKFSRGACPRTPLECVSFRAGPVEFR